ncbi:MAG TPA: hypothetical protein VF779_17625 [Pyrinomonadaceae bacterium]
MNTTNTTRTVPRSFRQIDELVYELYELTPDEIALVEASRT